MILGVDYASVDGNKPPGWGLLKPARVRLVIIRAVWGTTVDPTFARDWVAAKAAGFVRGGYIYLRSPRKGKPSPPGPDIQAQAAIKAIGHLEPTDLPPCLDVEYPGDGGIETGLSVAQRLEWVHTAWKVLRDAYGVPPVIYTSARVWREDLNNIVPPSEMTNSPLWLARYPFKARVPATMRAEIIDKLAWPPVPPPWGDASNVWLHQYHGDALQVPGFTSTVDLNRFRTTKIGDTGDRIKWVQHRLGQPETGIFGPELQAAVKNLQGQHGLDIDGIIGPATFAVICWCNGVERPLPPKP